MKKPAVLVSQAPILQRAPEVAADENIDGRTLDVRRELHADDESNCAILSIEANAARSRRRAAASRRRQIDANRQRSAQLSLPWRHDSVSGRRKARSILRQP